MSFVALAKKDRQSIPLQFRLRRRSISIPSPPRSAARGSGTAVNFTDDRRHPCDEASDEALTEFAANGSLLLMTVVRKNSPIESLGLGPGVHLLKLVITGDTVAYEVAATTPPSTPQLRPGTGFVGRWSGTARKMDIPSDDWFAHINAKHLR